MGEAALIITGLPKLPGRPGRVRSGMDNGNVGTWAGYRRPFLRWEGIEEADGKNHKEVILTLLGRFLAADDSVVNRRRGGWPLRAPYTVFHAAGIGVGLEDGGGPRFGFALHVPVGGGRSHAKVVRWKSPKLITTINEVCANIYACMSMVYYSINLE